MSINQKSTYYLSLFLDLFIVNFSFIAAATLAQSFNILLQRNYMFVLMAIMNFVWYFVSNVIDYYEDFSIRNFSYQFIKILKNTAAQIITGIIFVFVTKEDLFNRNFILYYSILLVILTSIRTQVLKIILGQIRSRDKNIKNLIIVGAGEIAKDFHKIISNHSEFGYNFLGFIDNGSAEENIENILGHIDELEQILPQNNIDEVIIALPIFEAEQIDKIIRICNKNGARVYIIPDYFRFLSKKFQVSMIGNFPIITVRSEPLAEFHWQVVKRTFDIIFSSLVIVFILTWLFPLISILNKIYSNGPLLFIQDRVGANNKIFKCYKFRTMYTNITQENKFQPTVENDPRITKIGRFLRKSNIDEIPQFINVLKGKMSIVGPRPHALPYNEIYQNIVEDIKIRSWVKPGISGWAQIHGLRGDAIDIEENKKRTIKRIEYDLWYIENWTFWLDIQIILTTIWQMFRGETKAV